MGSRTALTGTETSSDSRPPGIVAQVVVGRNTPQRERTLEVVRNLRGEGRRGSSLGDALPGR